MADEVRSLAQGSAATALENKKLIGDAMAIVQAGSALADTAGATMEEVVQSVQRMADMIGHIGAAEAEQRSQIAALDEARSGIDTVNRCNAESTLQASVGASRIGDESAALATLLCRFTLSAPSVSTSNVRCRTDSLENAQNKAGCGLAARRTDVAGNRALLDTTL